MTDVDIRTDRHAGRITLNRPQALNALTLPMIQAIHASLDGWAADPAIVSVLIDGAGGRALCAGGDIRALYDAARNGNLAIPRAFFAAEYAMNGAIAAFPKPYIAIMDGVVMGGGVGISAHGTVRIVTERTLLAMPETGIGLFPDVGATWLLSRKLPLGLHLALTGARIGAADAILAGLADYYVPGANLPALIDTLCACATPADVHALIETQAEPPPPATVFTDRAWMDSCYRHSTMELILDALHAEHAPAAAAAAADIAGKSPSSLKVSLRALRAAETMDSLHQALDQELVIAIGCMRSHDFTEGVRAAIIDKDRNPAWRPATLADVTDELVDAYFV